MNKEVMFSRLYRELADTLNISETMTNDIVNSYNLDSRQHITMQAG